jgi:glycosyltransferase involved in cell wall biosynthesis
MLTDSKPHGDGLLAHRFISELAARGHHIAVACESVALRAALSTNVAIYPQKLALKRFGIVGRIEYALRMRLLFKRLSRQGRFDLAHQLNPVYTGLSLGLIGLKIPIVLGPYVPYWPVQQRLKGLQNVVSGLQQRLSDAIILATPAAQTRIASKHIAAERIFTVPYGIDLEAFPEHPMPSGKPVILYLAGLAERKGIRTLLAAFDKIAQRLPTAELIIAGGSGRERSRIEAVAAKSMFRDHITFVGNVPRENVSQILAKCSVFCLPSFGEPYGMSLIEAMATGRPVVATDAGGPVDLVDPRGGILVPPGDVRAMADALVSILNEPDRASAMGAFNRSAVSAYSWPVTIDRLEAVYEAVSPAAARLDADDTSAAQQITNH